MKFIKMSLAGLILSVSCFTNVSHAGLITDPLEDKIVTVGNLDWAWASPCSGGCSQLVDDWEYAGGVYTDLLNAQLEVSTWRFASVSEWALLPSAASFRNDNKCAAAWFDNRHSHCDYGDPTSRIPVGGYSETFVVRTNSVVNAVPEPSTLVVFALGMIGLVSRRFKKQS